MATIARPPPTRLNSAGCNLQIIVLSLGILNVRVLQYSLLYCRCIYYMFCNKFHQVKTIGSVNHMSCMFVTYPEDWIYFLCRSTTRWTPKLGIIILCWVVPCDSFMYVYKTPMTSTPPSFFLKTVKKYLIIIVKRNRVTYFLSLYMLR